ncbi:MAG: aminotransferase class I/II-fold pyridoxal phosphate-dependent enzyme [Pirellula sp.]
MNPEISRRAWIGTTAAGILAVPAISPWSQELLPCALANDSKQSSKIAPLAPNNSLPIRILFNENPMGCSPAAKDAVEHALSRGNFYPLEQAGQLVNKLRAKHGMPALPESKGLSLRPQTDANEHALVLGGGSSELLLAAALAYSVDGGNVVEPTLTYQTIGNTSKNRPGPAIERRQIPLLANGSIDADTMLAACDSQTKILVITNPNNPTGNAIGNSELIKLVTKAPSRTLVVVDEAYIDFLNDPESRTVIPHALQRDNLMVTRTFSKIHGLAGLRCGYAIGHKSIFTRMQPFQVGSLSLNLCGLAAATVALDDVAFQEASRAMATESRQRITAQLNTLGFRVAKSDAACIWAEWDRETAPLVSRLADRGVLISTGLRWNVQNSIRISVATPWQTTKLLEELTDSVRA